jgi:hypothetical protein
VAVGVAGIAVGVGAFTLEPPHAPQAARSMHAPQTSVVMSEADALLMAREDTNVDRVSRDAVRPPLLSEQRADKAASLPPSRQDVGGAMTKSVVVPATPKDVASSLLGSYGWDSGQFSCLDALWTRESNWNMYAQNSSSGAYGIPQALPGSKMATAGSDWATNATTQITWGLSYISASYGSPCGAWYHSESYGWY